MIGTTCLKRLQKEVKYDSCNPGRHGNFGKEPWNIFPEDVVARTLQIMACQCQLLHFKRPCARDPNVFASVMYLCNICVLNMYLEVFKSNQANWE